MCAHSPNAPRKSLLIPLLSLALVCLGACAEWSDPADFDAERAALQEEWEQACGEPCVGDDMPAACGITGDAKACSAYNSQYATACIDLYEKVIRRDICKASDHHMVQLGEVCNAVYLECDPGETDTGSTDTGGDTDTSGTDTN
jgi:hypothetical protein